MEVVMRNPLARIWLSGLRSPLFGMLSSMELSRCWELWGLIGEEPVTQFETVVDIFSPGDNIGISISFHQGNDSGLSELPERRVLRYSSRELRKEESRIEFSSSELERDEIDP